MVIVERRYAFSKALKLPAAFASDPAVAPKMPAMTQSWTGEVIVLEPFIVQFTLDGPKSLLNRTLFHKRLSIDSVFLPHT